MQTLPSSVLQAFKAPNATQSASSGDSVKKHSEGDAEKFDKILQREVSESPNKQEVTQKTTKADAAKTSTDSKSYAESNNEEHSNTTSEQSSNKTVDNLLATTETKYQFDQAIYPVNIALDAAPQVPPSMMPAGVSSTSVLNDHSVAGDGESPQNALPLTNPIMLQKTFVQSALDENNVANTPTNLLQSVDTANSADFGKLFPLGADATKSLTVQLDKNLLASPIESSGSSLASINALPALTSSHASNIPTHNIHVDTVVGQPKWGNEFAQKIIWMNNQQQQVAEIHLNPANLGPVEVTLSITQDQATAQFVSPHASVREAIQDALPRLKEMLADNGIQLGNVTVGAESFQQDPKQQQGYDSLKGSSNRAMSGTETPSTAEVTHTVPIRHHGIVNTFA
ncbi:MAG TPA: flagellar hook-length control protein FliK [Nitrosomonas sp.]|nr:flagellar hook-length control protein FliK [Nitrosomonas sp.]